MPTTGSICGACTTSENHNESTPLSSRRSIIAGTLSSGVGLPNPMPMRTFIGRASHGPANHRRGMYEDDAVPASSTEWTEPAVEEVADGVHRIPLPLPNDGLRAVNVYVVRDADGRITLIDSGWAIPEARELLVEMLGKIGHGAGDIARFLVTHIHRDHYTLGISLRREFGTKVALGAGERPS